MGDRSGGEIDRPLPEVLNTTFRTNSNSDPIFHHRDEEKRKRHPRWGRCLAAATGGPAITAIGTVTGATIHKAAGARRPRPANPDRAKLPL